MKTGFKPDGGQFVTEKLCLSYAASQDKIKQFE